VRRGCDSRCVADTRADAYDGASWRVIEDSWQWTAGLVTASLAFAALLGWAAVSAFIKRRGAAPLFGLSIALYLVWALVF